VPVVLGWAVIVTVSPDAPELWLTDSQEEVDHTVHGEGFAHTVTATSLSPAGRFDNVGDTVIPGPPSWETVNADVPGPASNRTSPCRGTGEEFALAVIVTVPPDVPELADTWIHEGSEDTRHDGWSVVITTGLDPPAAGAVHPVGEKVAPPVVGG
jgi:hypothetical protein